jgi:hypothetical protein
MTVQRNRTSTPARSIARTNATCRSNLHRRKTISDVLHRSRLPAPGEYHAGCNPIAARDLGHLGARRQCLFDDSNLVVLRPASSPPNPAQNLNPHPSMTLKLDLRSHASRDIALEQDGPRRTSTCQVALSLSVANHAASLPVAYRLYLPEAWTKEGGRRQACRRPSKTKPQIALEQIRWACESGLPRGVALTAGTRGCVRA